MHKRIDLKKSIKLEQQAMDVEELRDSDDSQDEHVDDQNNIANMVIKLFNKKVG